MKVIIDDVEYIPAKNALANRMDIIRGLLSIFWGTCSDETAEELYEDPNIRVIVSDSSNEGISLKEMVDEIAKIAC